MSSANAASAGSGKPSRPLVVRILLGFIKRVYALALIALVLYLSFSAFAYLVNALILQPPPPPQIVDLPLRADEGLLETNVLAFRGVTAVENPRVPLAHYHRVGAWFQPDPANNCTQSGCHAPLPHGENRANRAFLNMHATSLHCGVCHLDAQERPLELVWYDNASGAPQSPPALLRAYALLLEPPPPDEDEAGPFQAELVGALNEAAQAADDNPVLAELTRHVAAVRPGTRDWARILDVARAEIPQHFRGEYGAKLALRNAGGQPRLGHPGNAAAVTEYLARAESAAPEELAELLARVHPARRAAPLACGDCHRTTDSLVDLGAVGYPAPRIERLRDSMITRMIDNIAAGRTFQMPGFLDRPEDVPTTLPAGP